MLIHFHLKGDSESLFTADLPIIPRVGELVSYEFSPIDRELWNMDSLERGENAHKRVRNLFVTEVSYNIRKLSVGSSDYLYIYVQLAPSNI